MSRPQWIGDASTQFRAVARAVGFDLDQGKLDAALVQHVIRNAYLNAMTLDIDCGTRWVLNNMKRSRRKS
ncbi:MAG: hypothetical protein EPN73_11585 [Paraburkholderia sp.]|uniref:hypothetical protein n=1 Tax=Paraburkholderia sp. TaxID=1926495 RepID=UPI0011F95132|nr:hypothetical protein [Paraburkholderia sp.]TAL95957.1 MAG: hypothetical protein EPN73_11585 [Paraburkholderia sp.]